MQSTMPISLTPRRRRRVLVTTPTNEGKDASNIIIQQQQQRDAASTSSMERALRTLATCSSTPPPTSSCRSRSSSSTKSPPRPKSGGQKSRSFHKKQSDNSICTKTTTTSSATTPTTSSSSNNSVTNSEEVVKVAIRVRPLVPEGDQCADRAWTISTERNAITENNCCQRRESIYSSTTNHSRRGITLGTTATTTSTESEFVYDRVFGEESNTNEIYDALVSDVVESLTNGINGTVFTYGQTCSGKTFTMQGCCHASESSSSSGIIQLAARQIFQFIKGSCSDDDDDEKMMKSEYSVNVSYMEIYNEELRDLLNNNNHKSCSNSLLIRENKHGSITVEGLQEVQVGSLEELMNVFWAGEKNKSVGSTNMNDRSSRSHAILSISLERKTTTVFRRDTDEKENYEDSSLSSNLVVKTTSTLNLVDLAGSESVRHTNAAGIQKKEGGMINQSLLTLSKVLMSLGQKYPGHINYRDSKLTRILKPSLSGNARMVVVCCISPSSKYVEETKSTLQFAARAKLVKTNAVVNEEVQGADIIAKLKMENNKCKMENRRLAEQLREKEMKNTNTFSTERKLANLKKFVFSAAAYETRSNSRLSSIVADDHSVIAIGREKASIPSILPTSAYLTQKDDSYIHQTISCGTDGILLRALKVKAEQVKNLQNKLRYSKLEKKHYAQQQNRYSLVKLAQSCNGNRRNSLIAEARRSDIEQEKEDDQDEDNSLTEIDLLESKLAHAKSLIVSLELQIDDLSLQKNDAIDWIEELLAKSDRKDAKMKCLNEEKNVATKRCENLEDELLKIKELCDEQFCLDADSVNANIISFETKITLLELENADLKSRLLDQQNLTGEYDDEKRALIEQIETYAEDLTILNASLKSKSDELDDALFSLETERKKGREEKNYLMEQKNNSSSHPHDEFNGSIRGNVKLLNEENTHNQATGTNPNEYCPEKETLHHDNGDKVQVGELMEKNNILTIEQSRLRDENDDLAKRVRIFADELAEQRRRQTKAEQDNVMKAKNALLEQKISDLSNEIRTIQQQLKDANKREENSVVAFFKSESEKSRLKSQLNDTNARAKEHSDKIQAVTNELCRYESAKVKQNLTMRKIQERIDELTLENAEMREKKESLTRTLDCLRNEICELRRLQSITIAERNDAFAKRDDLMNSNANLTCDLKMISVERDRLWSENERIQMTLHKITADSEADNELLRSNVGSLLKEKVDLEDKIVFLEASKASIEKNADRILQRDNTLTRQHEHLEVEYKKQSKLNAELQCKIDKMMKRMDCMRVDNEKLTRDNKTLRELYQRSARF